MSEFCRIWLHRKDMPVLVQEGSAGYGYTGRICRSWLDRKNRQVLVRQEESARSWLERKKESGGPG